MSKSYRELALDGLWNNNPATVQILGLCPLLAVTGSVVNAMGLGLATLVVLMGSNACVSLIRHYVTDAVRLPAFVMIIAAMVTVIEMLMQAYTFELYEILGIFIPLIVTNCAVLGRADAFASKNAVLPSMVDGFMMGLGFLVILLILGGMRELVGQGTLFTNMQLLFGPMAANWELTVIDNYGGFLLAILPPGAFLGLGLIIAGKNVIDKRLKEVQKRKASDEPKVSRRVRTTGKVS
ncbi:electron transport complex subunit RsxE [Alcanivorax sp. HI0083]|uniref:electron transport complex subunit E n=1 Tax=unclassified Alcanivorax TaxID=2638842 RepID=UPI0007B840FB|nr:MULTISPECIES: electron transport complex subunit E [unclassified Alcanivorax]KZY29398.1 electron transport complex subunit RsxE [Alcanivorax sp. HI0044]KZY34386.1 electron transport complex subunit RsxE [Alcanivorax sp. HI0044]KZZ27546.1 electron transport complex subunit RsxE [Alcanivorax sp. HI0083]